MSSFSSTSGPPPGNFHIMGGNPLGAYMTSGTERISNSKESSLVRPKNGVYTEKTRDATLKRLMEKSKSNTLGSSCLVHEVKCPLGVDRDEWIASKCVEIFDELNLLAGCIQHLCTKEKCCKMSAGNSFEWLWAANSGDKPKELSALEYFKECLLWSDDIINDTTLFPIDPGVPFPAHFHKNVSIIFKRFFRLYAHVYYHHFQELLDAGAGPHLNYNFKHFLFVGIEFDLIQLKEMEALREMVEGFMKERLEILSEKK